MSRNLDLSEYKEKKSIQTVYIPKEKCQQKEDGIMDPMWKGLPVIYVQWKVSDQHETRFPERVP